ncbi:MAG: LacI family transcriptional regulator [Verrucomicrobiae bacterium]|nr:LacI family transcriptional regulator [Verrucomicrobiae bacterium]
MVSIRKISEVTNYSVATVSEALRNSGRVREETRMKILKAAEQLGYQRNSFVGEVMSRMRRSQVTDYRGTVAVLESKSFQEARMKSRWHKEIFKGAVDRANDLGFKLDFFQFEDSHRSFKRIHQVLVSRGIEGIFLPPYAHSWNLEGIDWNCFSAVQLDYGLENVRMHTVMPDHHTSLLNSLKRLEAMGYRRPGLFVERFQDDRIMLKWLAGYEAFINKSTECSSVSVFEPEDLERENFFEWFRRYRPDVLLGHRSEVIGWLEEEGIETPKDVGFFSLNLHHTPRQTAGLNLQPRLIGAAAIEILISQIHLQQRGVPKTAYTTSIEGEWVDGFSIRNLS